MPSRDTGGGSITPPRRRNRPAQGRGVGRSSSQWWVVLAVAGAAVACRSPVPDDQLAPLRERFQSEFDRLRQTAGFPGGTAAFVTADGQVVGVATGYADLETAKPMSPDTKLLAGCVGKTFVAAVALALVQEGKLALDDRVATWLGDEPWFNRLPNAPAITLRMLLTHSSGLGDHVYVEQFAADVLATLESDPDRTFTPSELIAYVLDTDPLFPPGQGFAYTDTGYLLAGLVIERAAGATYYEEVTRRFLKPLDLRDTVPADHRDIDGLATGYVHEENLLGLPRRTLTEDGLVLNPGIEWTGGGLASNPQDLVRWAKVLYEGRAVEGPYLDELLRAVPRDPQHPEGSRYGLGVNINETPFGITYGHGGWFPAGYRTLLAYFPAPQMAVAVQVNTDYRQNVFAYVMALADVVLPAGGG